METCTNSLSDNFVLKGFPALKKEQERGKVFFCIKKEGRRGRLGVDREEGLIREGVYWKPSHVRKGKPTVNK